MTNRTRSRSLHGRGQLQRLRSLSDLNRPLKPKPKTKDINISFTNATEFISPEDILDLISTKEDPIYTAIPKPKQLWKRSTSLTNACAAFEKSVFDESPMSIAPVRPKSLLRSPKAIRREELEDIDAVPIGEIELDEVFCDVDVPIVGSEEVMTVESAPVTNHKTLPEKEELEKIPQNRKELEKISPKREELEKMNPVTKKQLTMTEYVVLERLHKGDVDLDELPNCPVKIKEKLKQQERMRRDSKEEKLKFEENMRKISIEAFPTNNNAHDYEDMSPVNEGKNTHTFDAVIHVPVVEIVKKSKVFSKPPLRPQKTYMDLVKPKLEETKKCDIDEVISQLDNIEPESWFGKKKFSFRSNKTKPKNIEPTVADVIDIKIVKMETISTVESAPLPHVELVKKDSPLSKFRRSSRKSDKKATEKPEEKNGVKLESKSEVKVKTDDESDEKSAEQSEEKPLKLGSLLQLRASIRKKKKDTPMVIDPATQELLSKTDQVPLRLSVSTLEIPTVEKAPEKSEEKPLKLGSLLQLRASMRKKKKDAPLVIEPATQELLSKTDVRPRLSVSSLEHSSPVKLETPIKLGESVKLGDLKHFKNDSDSENSHIDNKSVKKPKLSKRINDKPEVPEKPPRSRQPSEQELDESKKKVDRRKDSVDKTKLTIEEPARSRQPSEVELTEFKKKVDSKNDRREDSSDNPDNVIIIR